MIKTMVRFINTKRIEAAMPEGWRKRRIRLDGYERIGGMTNRNYKITVGNETLVMRLPGRGTGRFISRSDEKINQEAAASAGFAPESLYFNRRNGVKITPFLGDAVPLSAETAQDPDRYVPLASFLARFHGQNLTFANSFEVFRKIRTYERLALQRLAPFYPGYRRCRNSILQLKTVLGRMTIPLKPCHNDLVPENILMQQGRFLLIDWEYSGMNDPAWDIGSLLLETAMPSADAQRFIRAYIEAAAANVADPADAAAVGSEDEAAFLQRIQIYQILQDALWSLWSLCQATDYRRYGALRFERCRAMIQSFEAAF